MKALIIGAGVCGPVTAMALRRAGIESVVYEAHDPATADVGSYLTVATNGLDGLMALDVHQGVLDSSFPTPRTVLLSGTGKLLGTVAIGSTTSEAVYSRTIKRAHLHRALHEAATTRGIDIQYGRRLVGAESSAHGVVAHFHDGSCASGDLLIGCDGVHSVARRLIDTTAPDPRYVGLLNFGGYTPRLTVAAPGAWHMIFGRRAFFGYATDQAGGTVWFANVPRHPSSPGERASTSTEQWKRWLLELFADDQGHATELIGAGALELAADNTHDLPSVPTWHRGSMIVIGDAAHAPSPSSGQGASMAIEDAVVLGKCLRDSRDASSAFTAFEGVRRKRVERIVAYGARSSSTKAAGAVGRVLRDLALPFVFRHFVTEKTMAWMYEHHIEWEAATS
jgi:2-polyprenyl-6-methoxyphenol hydroxylase-like FAD-dependent oxidoreductase